MKIRLFVVTLIVLAFDAWAMAQEPAHWFVGAMCALGGKNGPKTEYRLEGGYFFYTSPHFRLGIGAGASLAKPMSEITTGGDRVFGYSEWAVPVYARGEFIKPTRTNASFVFRADAGYRIGVHTAYYQGTKDITGNVGSYLSGIIIEPQIGILISEKLLFSVGCCLQQGRYSQTSIIPNEISHSSGVSGKTEEVKAILPTISAHIEYRF